MAARIHSRAAIAVYARGISVVPGKEGRDGAARQRVVVPGRNPQADCRLDCPQYRRGPRALNVAVGAHGLRRSPARRRGKTPRARSALGAQRSSFFILRWRSRRSQSASEDHAPRPRLMPYVAAGLQTRLMMSRTVALLRRRRVDGDLLERRHLAAAPRPFSACWCPHPSPAAGMRCTRRSSCRRSRR